MSPPEAFAELLERLAAQQGQPASVDEEELAEWPGEAVHAMKAQRIIVRTEPAKSAICSGCEWQCTMEVHVLPGGDRQSSSLFILCDKPPDMNRVAVPAARIRQWPCTLDVMRGFVAHSLGLRLSNSKPETAGLWEVGIAQGDKRRQMLCLRANRQIELVAGGSALPLPEFVRWEAGRFLLESSGVRQLVDTSNSVDSRYTPSVAGSEARKRKTQEMHAGWRQAFRELKAERPGRPDVWYAKQSANSGVGQGCTVDTVRKNMKGRQN
jgi:hypothetical protein